MSIEHSSPLEGLKKSGETADVLLQKPKSTPEKGEVIKEVLVKKKAEIEQIEKTEKITAEVNEYVDICREELGLSGKSEGYVEKAKEYILSLIENEIIGADGLEGATEEMMLFLKKEGN